MSHIQKISNLIEGQWQGKMGEDMVEEIWSNFNGKSIMGMFRWVKDTKARFYEFIVIDENDKEVTMKIKHFNEDMTGWEGKDDYVEYILKEISETELIFGSSDPKEKGKLIYTRPNQSELLVVLEMEDGKELKFNFMKQ